MTKNLKTTRLLLAIFFTATILESLPSNAQIDSPLEGPDPSKSISRVAPQTDISPEAPKATTTGNRFTSGVKYIFDGLESASKSTYSGAKTLTGWFLRKTWENATLDNLTLIASAYVALNEEYDEDTQFFALGAGGLALAHKVNKGFKPAAKATIRRAVNLANSKVIQSFINSEE